MPGSMTAEIGELGFDEPWPVTTEENTTRQDLITLFFCVGADPMGNDVPMLCYQGSGIGFRRDWQ